jgi:DNA-binding transcriptional LysR family regulator
MEWDDLKHFLAVARAGSLRDAARALKSSAATVGRRIAALEARLGARLFDRQQTGYRLTESGEAIRLKAEQVEEAVLSVEREAIGRDLRATGKVRITTTDDIGSLVIGPNLGQFRRSFPGISLEIVRIPEVINLAKREADIALRTVRPTHGDVIMRQVGWWNLGLYAASGYAAAHDLKPGVNDFSKVDIISWNEEVAHWRGGPWFAEHARGSAVVLAANTRRIHHAACKAGVGVAILPCLMADNDPDLVCLLPPVQVISVEMWLVVHRDLIRTARVRAVMDFLAEVVPITTAMRNERYAGVADGERPSGGLIAPAGRSGSTYPSAGRPSSAPRSSTGRPGR